MKTEINNYVFTQSSLKQNVGEIKLFRAMESSLNIHCSAILVEETHGNKGHVRFSSNLTKKFEKREIADLIIISKSNNDYKLSFLQAKYHRTKTSPFLEFYGDYLQLELLKTRPNIDKSNSFGFPENILNFSKYRSLSTYGIFYHDISGSIDMLYTTADLLTDSGVAGRIKGKIIFPGNVTCPCLNCSTSFKDELISTCNIDLFERALLAFQVGAPIIDVKVKAFIRKMLQNILKRDPTLGDRITRFIPKIDEDYGVDLDVVGNPNILLIEIEKEIRE